MAAVKTPDVGLPAGAPEVVLEYAPKQGESEERVWTGAATDTLDSYNLLKLDAQVGGLATGNVTTLRHEARQGRGRLIIRYERAEKQSAEEGDANTKVVEELYAVDMSYDILQSPYYEELTNSEVAWVRKCYQQSWSDDQITYYAALVKPAQLAYASWSDLMKSLHYHLQHGQTNYLQTGFVLRRTMHGAKTSDIAASFTGINTVVTAPVFQTDMDKLIAALPDGEWLYRPPQAEHMGKGKWRITKEWQWSPKWSIMYGGTFNGPPSP